VLSGAGAVDARSLDAEIAALEVQTSVRTEAAPLDDIAV
jgi:hypothetical protein